MATHSSILAWEIPWTEKAGRLRPWSHKKSDMTEQAPTIHAQKVSRVYIYMEASIWAATLLISAFLIFNILVLSTGTFNH